MNFLALGLNHRSTPLEIREQLAVEKDQLPQRLEELNQRVDQGVIISTCNRLELYTFGDDTADLTEGLNQFIESYSGLSIARLEPHLYQYQDQQCVSHLFRVASGLDSMILGEKQILGQVRAAYSAASQSGYVRGPLSRLFHQALRAGRRIHRDTNIGKHSRSISQAAALLARRLLGDLSQQRALVIGVGDAGRLVARALNDAGVRQMVVTNRTYCRAAELAQKLGGIAVPFEELAQQLVSADVVITSTGAPGYVLEEEAMRAAIAQRRGRPLLLIDIAVPRDIDPAVGRLDNVKLYDIDSLQIVAESDASTWQTELTHAEGIVVEETANFLDWWRSMGVTPLIAAIRQQAEQTRQEEVSRTLQMLGDDWPAGAEERLNALTEALVKKLLHHPTMYIKEGQHPYRQQLARQMFNVDEGGAGSGRTKHN